MQRVLYASAVAVGVLALVAGPASAANNPGSCSLPGGVANWNVKEQPGEGDVDYISLSSPVRLSTGSATHAYLFNSDGLQVNVTYYFHEVSVPGNGLYNYRTDPNWVHTDAFTQIARVWMNVHAFTGTAQCGGSTYI